MTDTQIGAALAGGFRGPRERRRIEAKPDSTFAGFWIEVDAASLTNGEVEVLRRNRYWHDSLRLIAPHIVGWNYVAETVEGVEEPAVMSEDGATELAPARTVYRVVGEEPIPPPAEGGVDSLNRVHAIELARGVKADDGTLGWIVARLRGYREELSDDVKKLLASLTAGATTASDVAPPSTPGPPSPTSNPSPTPKTSPRRSKSTLLESGPPSG